MRKPVIGIAARYYIDENGQQKYHISMHYCEKLSRMGAIPVLLFPKDIEQIIEMVDGILLPGGYDVDPSHYQEPIHETTQIVSSWVDELDFHLVHLCKEKQIPIFGICRGLQSINVALGGTLYQDIPSQYPNALSHDQKEIAYHIPHHTITTIEGSLIHHLVGKEYAVNSFHHQAIKKLGDELSITATSHDGIVECIEGNGIFAVQFHPEMMQDEKSDLIFKKWIEICRSQS